MDNLVMEMEFLMNKGVLPIKVRLELQKKFPDVSKQEIIKEIALHQEWISRYNHCEKVGHLIQGISYVSKESGSEDFYCKRCGYSQSVIYY